MDTPTYLIVALCFLFAFGTGLCLYLFITLKREVRAAEKSRAGQQEEADSALKKLRGEIAALLVEIDKRSRELPQLAAPKPSMNLTRRSQVLRMHSRGERPEHISAALGLPQAEVNLVLKTHRPPRAA